MSTALPTFAPHAGLSSRREESPSVAVSSRWCLQRNCSTTPSVLLTLFGLVAAVSLGIGAFFWSHGAPLVLPFALIEVAAVGLALVVYARHAVDGDRLRLERGQLIVERRCGSDELRFEFDAQRVRVHAAPDGAIELHEGRRHVRVGECAAAWRRAQALREINEALAQSRRTAGTGAGAQ